MRLASCAFVNVEAVLAPILLGLARHLLQQDPEAIDEKTQEYDGPEQGAKPGDAAVHHESQLLKNMQPEDTDQLSNPRQARNPDDVNVAQARQAA
mmetsp:Transcript_107233/g.210220  ORF Transcript_107233/g.210220 Transcript_107233/m.210220 type:complete len:95 (-) Transcript_107233:442-726(-)